MSISEMKLMNKKKALRFSGRLSYKDNSLINYFFFLSSRHGHYLDR